MEGGPDGGRGTLTHQNTHNTNKTRIRASRPLVESPRTETGCTAIVLSCPDYLRISLPPIIVYPRAYWLPLPTI